MLEILESGKTPAASDFGGLQAIVDNVDEIVQSGLQDEFLKAALSEFETDPPLLEDFSAEIAIRTSDDIVMREVIDSIAPFFPFNPQPARRLFYHWLSIATRKDLSASIRSAALRGAFFAASGDDRKLLRLEAEIADTDTRDDADYIAHAARIGGLLHARSGRSEVVAFLEEARASEDAQDQVLFEIGMIRFSQAVDASEISAVSSLLDAAKDCFEGSWRARETRFDARVFSMAIGLLLKFYSGADARQMTDDVAELNNAVHGFSTYQYRSGYSSLDGARAMQTAVFASMGRRLAALATSLNKPVWLDGARIVEEELLGVYSANRTVISGKPGTGIPVIISPRVEASFFRSNHQLEIVKTWLDQFGPSSTEDLSDIRHLVDGLTHSPPANPIDAALGSPTIAAAIHRVRSSGLPGIASLETALSASYLMEAAKLSPVIAATLERIDETFESVPDYHLPEAKGFFLALALRMLLFLEYRLNTTPSQDPSGAYLFHKHATKAPLEATLQQDLLRTLKQAAFGTSDEVRGIGGGRTDILHQHGRYSLITEVKRELKDASFQALLANYGEQTAAYQNTNLKLGTMMVLDLSTGERIAPAMETLVHPYVGDVLGDGITRGILIINVPGNLISPSAASAKAKKLRKPSQPSTLVPDEK